MHRDTTCLTGHAVSQHRSAESRPCTDWSANIYSKDSDQWQRKCAVIRASEPIPPSLWCSTKTRYCLSLTQAKLPYSIKVKPKEMMVSDSQLIKTRVPDSYGVPGNNMADVNWVQNGTAKLSPQNTPCWTRMSWAEVCRYHSLWYNTTNALLRG